MNKRVSLPISSQGQNFKSINYASSALSSTKKKECQKENRMLFPSHEEKGSVQVPLSHA